MSVYIYLIDSDGARYFNRFFDGTKVHIRNYSILDQEFSDGDTVVSPANSFGFMDGGICGLYRDKWGEELERELKFKIMTEMPFGELLVGQTIELGIPGTRLRLLAAPTMRTPQKLGPYSLNPFLAARAAFSRIAGWGDTLGDVHMPAFGTGIGGMSCKSSARQMRKAYDYVLGGKPNYPQSSAQSEALEVDIYYGE